MTWKPTPRSLDGGIDEVPLPDAAGRLWLCGKHVVGPDPEAALTRVGADTIVCLNEPSELSDRYPGYVSWLRTASTERAVWFPIPDLHGPTLVEVTPMVVDLLDRVRRGDGLIVHCGAGIGRAGTAAVLLLIGLGMSEDEALAHVAEHRPMAGPQADTQAALIAAYARRQRKPSS